ncbi:hypothetical protein PFTANZ_01929, partial [Plasmodium falciparum Tanzania (2000708)]
MEHMQNINLIESMEKEPLEMIFHKNLKGLTEQIVDDIMIEVKDELDKPQQIVKQSLLSCLQHPEAKKSHYPTDLASQHWFVNQLLYQLSEPTNPLVPTGEQSDTLRLLRPNDRKSRHRRIKKLRR